MAVNFEKCHKGIKHSIAYNSYKFHSIVPIDRGEQRKKSIYIELSRLTGKLIKFTNKLSFEVIAY